MIESRTITITEDDANAYKWSHVSEDTLARVHALLGPPTSITPTPATSAAYGCDVCGHPVGSPECNAYDHDEPDVLCIAHMCRLDPAGWCPSGLHTPGPHDRSAN